MTSKFFAGAVAVVLAASVPHVASAKTFNIGLLNEGGSEDEAFIGGKVKSNLSDILTFSISGIADLNASLENIVSTSGRTTYNFSNLKASFYSGAYSATPVAGTEIGTLTGSSSATFSSLASGDYYALINGARAQGADGGQYSLSLFATQQAAPAPGPGGALVAGAAVAALVFRRRLLTKTVAA